VVPDVYPLTVKIYNNFTFGYIEDINDENEEEYQPFDDKTTTSRSQVRKRKGKQD
jgi:uncharacterized protein YdbL (DUF1318 family)